MDVRVWRIAPDTPLYTADDVMGAGAYAAGGRWNSPGHAVLYTSSNIALACLETAVHLDSAPMNRHLVAVDLPAAAWDARTELDGRALRVGWDAMPPGRVSIAIGDDWLATQASPVLVVPSAIVPEEPNVLVNPAHPLCAGLRARKLRKWIYDPRLLGPAR